MRNKKDKGKLGRIKKALYPLSLVLVGGACIYVLLPGFKELENVRSQIVELRQVARVKHLDNEALRKEIERMDTAEGVEQAARRHLRLARPDELLIVVQPPEDDSTTE